ncbi:hypothetical protein GJU40_18420 [Bacillus lacus]|uniref:YaaC family protein n=1 Tax=Metabacillus lacus TaxID=1983721 RepID=A0A7X2J270_9BACI|nr:YaaC family protein [Metabacillus lacus]MRX74101.1 hypothetical protein [Metabacillus lacus]
MSHTDIWHRYQSFHSTETVQRCLEKIYKNKRIEAPQEKAYQNGYSFIYYLKHAENFFIQGKNAPLAIQPLLYFYGLTQLLKACLLTVDPDYPASSSVLAHGVTSRKRKKQHYCFFEDEVKIQRNGLYDHVSVILFGQKQQGMEKYTMNQLLSRIPELADSYLFHREERPLTKVTVEANKLYLTEPMAAQYHMSIGRLQEFLQYNINHKQTTDLPGTVLLSKSNINPFFSDFLMYNSTEKQYYLPSDRENCIHLPELLTHYLLLYNLSMITRYETEWWYDLLLTHSNDSYVFISKFLDISYRKIPAYCLEYLLQAPACNGEDQVEF